MPDNAKNLLIDQLVVGRECGRCTACCKELVIDEPDFKKDADIWCPNCVFDEGCGIYPDSPEICKDWYCLWRLDDAFREGLRPDKCGVLFHLTTEHIPERFGRKPGLAAKATEDIKSFQAPDVVQLLVAYYGAGVPVFINFKDRSLLLNDALKDRPIPDWEALAAAIAEVFNQAGV